MLGLRNYVELSLGVDSQLRSGVCALIARISQDEIDAGSLIETILACRPLVAPCVLCSL